jgi:prepilin-type N-terminal cleavage/methylation domain-containing protein
MSSSRCRSARAFTLIEVMVVIVILTLLLSGLALPLAAQLQVRRAEETRRTLDVARDALLGFAASHGRLPCPASETSAGEEAFAPGGDASNGNCETFYAGWLPAATLGLSPVDAGGYLRDAWDTPRNRVRYAVFGNAAVNGVANPLTRASGLRMATLPGARRRLALRLHLLDGSERHRFGLRARREPAYAARGFRPPVARSERRQLAGRGETRRATSPARPSSCITRCRSPPGASTTTSSSGCR